MKRRITLVVDGAFPADWSPPLPDEGTPSMFWGYPCRIESVEDIPEPNRVQEFRVRIASRAADDPITAGYVEQALTTGASIYYPATVTEVEPTP